MNGAIDWNISTHAPHARCDANPVNSYTADLDFYSRTSCEVRPTDPDRIQLHSHFYSRTSCEVRPFVRSFFELPFEFLLTHLMRGATNKKGCYNPVSYISTHAPHARCDGGGLGDMILAGISTHAPHARCDAGCYPISCLVYYFYSRTSCEVRP